MPHELQDSGSFKSESNLEQQQPFISYILQPASKVSDGPGSQSADIVTDAAGFQAPSRPSDPHWRVKYPNFDRPSRDPVDEKSDAQPKDVAKVELENGKIVRVQSGLNELQIKRDSNGDEIEIKHINENRVWKKADDGTWTGSAIDADKAFTMPTDFERKVITSGVLDPLQKTRIFENGRAFEASPLYNQAQKTEFMRNLDRLFEDRPAAPFTAVERASYADQLLWHVANIKKNAQGPNNSCNVTALRGLNLTECPEIVARIVADVANTGEVKTKDNSIIKPPIDSIRPRQGSPEATFPPVNGGRSALGKLWDVTAINTFYQRQTKDPVGTKVAKGSVSYQEIAPTSRADNGNRIVTTFADGTKSMVAMEKNGKIDPFDAPLMYPSRVADVQHQLTGRNMKDKFLIHNNRSLDDSTAFNNLAGPVVRSEAEVEKFLEKGTFPFLVQGNTGILRQRYDQQVAVNAGNDASKITAGNGGEHIWLVTGYDAASKTVSLDNSWDELYDVPTRADATAQGRDLTKVITFSSSDLYESIARPTLGESYNWAYIKVN